jgi:hypothetical protein
MAHRSRELRRAWITPVLGSIAIQPRRPRAAELRRHARFKLGRVVGAVGHLPSPQGAIV